MRLKNFLIAFCFLSIEFCTVAGEDNLIKNIKALPPEMQLGVFSNVPEGLLINKEFNKQNKSETIEFKVIQKIKDEDLESISKNDHTILCKYYPLFYFSNDTKNFNDQNLKIPTGIKIQTTEFLSVTDVLYKHDITTELGAFCVLSIPIFEVDASTLLEQLQEKILPSIPDKVPIKILINRAYYWSNKYIKTFTEIICTLFQKSHKNIIAIDLPLKLEEFNIDLLLNLPKIKKIFVHPKIIFRNQNYSVLLKDPRIVPHTSNIQNIAKIFDLDTNPDIRDVIQYLQSYTSKNVVTPLLSSNNYPLHYCYNGIVETIKKLFEYRLIDLKSAETVFASFKLLGNYELTKFYLEHGMDPNFQFKDKNYLLHKLIQSGIPYGEDIETVKLLLEYGANPNLLNNENNTAFECLKPTDEHLKYAELLMHYQAQVSIKNFVEIFQDDWHNDNTKLLLFCFKNYNWKKVIPFLGLTAGTLFCLTRFQLFKQS